jgi:hypothetical protein
MSRLTFYLHRMDVIDCNLQQNEQDKLERAAMSGELLSAILVYGLRCYGR